MSGSIEVIHKKATKEDDKGSFTDLLQLTYQPHVINKYNLAEVFIFRSQLNPWFDGGFRCNPLISEIIIFLIQYIRC